MEQGASDAAYPSAGPLNLLEAGVAFVLARQNAARMARYPYAIPRAFFKSAGSISNGRIGPRMNHAAVAEMLEAWGPWSRQGRCGPPIPYCAGSAEGRHVAEAGEVFDSDLRATLPRISDDLGLQGQRAVVAAGRVFAVALTLYHVERLPVHAIARRLRVPDAGRVLDQAHAAVAYRLR